DNWEITPDALDEGFGTLPAGAAVATSPQDARSDLKPYLQLLERYLGGQMDVSDFEHTYTHMFRGDSTLRPGHEVEVLNSIFGDVDQHINMQDRKSTRLNSSHVKIS